MTKYLSLVFSVIVASLPAPLKADPIYSWKDAQGTTHYSSKPVGKDAKLADLPPIMKAEMKIPQSALTTCAKHGGVNCQAGTDTDGTVICYDGFRGSMERFAFTCNAPKLEVADVSEVSTDGSFSVFVRTARGVLATAPEVSVNSITGKQFKLLGPDSIEPFALAEFSFGPDPKRPFIQKPTVAQVEVQCMNCPS